MIIYPAQKGVRIGCLIRREGQAKSMELVLAHPLLSGYPNMLEIDARYTWSNGLSGEVAAHTPGTGQCLNFYVPTYFRNFDSFIPGSSRVVRLGALALSISKPESTDFSLTSGPLYETLLQEFLVQNPDATEQDFSVPVFSMDGMVALLPSFYSCYVELSAPVLEIARLTFLNIPLYRLLVPVFRDREGETCIYLYVREDILDGYLPEKGDNIRATAWLTGELDDALSEPAVIQ